MNPIYLLEGLGIAIPMTLIIYLVFKWVSDKKELQIELNKKTGKVEPANLCRGNWAEARMNQCKKGYDETGIPVEPVNSYSNLAYLIAGWVIFRHSSTDISIIFLVAMGFLCFGSAIYHGIKTRWSARFDHGGMYAVFICMVLTVILMGHANDTWMILIGTIVLSVVFGWFLVGGLMPIMGLLLVLISFYVFTEANVTLGIWSLVMFVLAMSIWLIDKNKDWLGRWGHGFWHVLTAIGLALMFSAIETV